MKNTSISQLTEMSEPDFFDKEVDIMIDKMNTVTFQFIGIGVAIWIGGMFQVSFFAMNKSKTKFQALFLTLVSTKIANRLRINYFRAVMRQDVGYFDVNAANEMNARLFEDIKKIQDGVGDKVCT